ncbi:MAG: PKD domain-containing protein [Schleiferiaceae bacterium]
MRNLFTAVLLAASAAALAQQPEWLRLWNDPTANVYDVVREFDSAFEGQAMEKGKGWKQFKRWEAFMEPRVYPTGQRPDPSALFQGMQQVQQNWGASSTGASGVGNWTPVGPFDGNPIQGIGRINVVAFHPTQANVIYAGAPAGGLWKSTDNGTTWSTNTDLLPNLGVSAIAIDPVHPDTMYIATGDRDGGDTYTIGVLKSTDGGETWNPTGLVFQLTNYTRTTGLVIHPTQTQTLVATTRAGFYRTPDGGATWSIAQGGSFQSLTSTPGAPHLLYAGTDSNGKVWFSRNFGQTWTMVTGAMGLPAAGPARCEVATTAADTNYVYALFGANNNGLYGVYRSTNKGLTWTQMHGSTPNLLDWSTTGNGSGGQAWYDLAIAVSPLYKDELLIGGVNIWKSNNGGANFSLSAHWYGGGGVSNVHADQHGFTFRPGTNEIWVGNDGGVYMSPNGGTNNSWQAKNNGLAVTQYYKIATTPANPTWTIAGAQDNGTHLNKTNWARVRGGDGMDCGMDPSNELVMYASIYYGDFTKSNNGGSSFNAPFNLPPSGGGNWVTPFLVSRHNGNVLYAGFTKLWKSTNAGVSFTATTSSNLLGTDNIDVLAESPSNPDVLYAGINQYLFRSMDGGATWTQHSGGAGSQVITGIAVDPLDPLHIIVSRSGYVASQKVFESYNGGQSYSNITGSLPNIPANAVAFEPGSNNLRYVGTDLGMFVRDNLLSDWVPFNAGLPNVIVNDIEILTQPRLVRIGTYGRGIWQSPFASDLLQRPQAAVATSPNSVCGTGDTVQLSDASAGLVTSWTWTVTPSAGATLIGATTANPKLVVSGPGLYTVQLIAANAYGRDTATAVQAVAVGGFPLPAREGFAGSLAGAWTVENPNRDATWASFAAGNDGDGQSMRMPHFDLSAAAAGRSDALISPVYALDSGSSLTFDAAYRTALATGPSDTLRVYVQSCGSSAWTLLATRFESGSQNWATGPAQASAFVPASAADWRRDSLYLGALAGAARFKFEARHGGGNHLYLDRFRLKPAAAPAPVADFLAPDSACTAQPVQLFAAGLPAPGSMGSGATAGSSAATYAWTFPGGVPAASSSANPVVSYASAGLKTATLTVTTAAGTSTLSKSFTVAAAVVPSVSIANQTGSVCANSPATFVATAVNGGASPRYQWTVNGIPRGFNSPTFTISSLQNGDVVKCELYSAEECPSLPKVVSAGITVTVLTLPASNAGSYAPECVGSAPIPLVGSPAGGVWSGTGVVGTTFDPTGLGPGTYEVTYAYTNAAGCTGTSTASIQLAAAPNVFLNFNTDVLCVSDPAVNPGGGYPSGGTYLLGGSSTTSINPATLGVGSYGLTYRYSNGLCLVERVDSFHVVAAPPAPTIHDWNGDSLYCPQTALNPRWTVQWLDGNQNPIAGATGSSYIAPTPGTYYVRLRAGNTCTATSGPSIVLSTNEFRLRGIQVQPNPSAGRFEVTWTSAGGSPWTAELRSLDGSLLGTYEGSEPSLALDLSHLPQGVYALTVEQSGRTATSPLVRL